ncbi:hypothetical protein TWF788_001323 [Orbilia oligospora]|uniref:Uncharacterized protein n=1 Tax=Orbilia oligospora TaxID=2813651 RepID=A0A7C8P6E0_ORBOL|nr:hypothetical protein TWF788_001323 [Orbilia oligospora]
MQTGRSQPRDRRIVGSCDFTSDDMKESTIQSLSASSSVDNFRGSDEETEPDGQESPKLPAGNKTVKKNETIEVEKGKVRGQKATTQSEVGANSQPTNKETRIKKETIEVGKGKVRGQKATTQSEVGANSQPTNKETMIKKEQVGAPMTS